MQVDLRRDRKLIAPQHSAESGQCGEDKLRRQPCCCHPRNPRQQANHKYQRRTRKGEQELGGCHGAVGWKIAGTNAADAQPTSEGNARHAHGDEDRELVVNVTVDGLECQQQENLQSHQCESGRSHRARCGRPGAFLAIGHKREKNRYKPCDNKDSINDAGESHVRSGPEPAGIAQLELCAPEHNVEVVGDRLEIVIDGRRGQRPQLPLDLFHAIGHHAEWDEVFANILRLQIPLLQPRHQRLGIVRQNIGSRSGEEVDGFAGDSDNVRENFPQGVMNAAQEFPEVGADVILRRAQLQGEQSAGREVIASGTKELGRVEPVQLRGLRIGHVKNDYVECAARRLERVLKKVSAIGVVHVHARIRDNRSGLYRKKLPRHVDERGIQFNVVDPLDRGMLQRLGDTAVHAAANH